MIKVLLFLTILLLGMIILTCQHQSAGYDPELAEELGADDHGIKSDNHGCPEWKALCF